MRMDRPIGPRASAGGVGTVIMAAVFVAVLARLLASVVALLAV